MVEEKDERLREFVKRVKEKFKPEKVLLFGSRARGEHLEESDHDILIVSEGFRAYEFKKRITEVYGLIDKPLNVEILCYTPEEFKRKSGELCIVKKAAEEGVPL